MQKYIDIISNAYTGYASYLWGEITNPSWNSYFYWLVLVSAFFFVLELVIPWRKNQAKIRKDFWLDFFYMFFNFFLFSLIIYNAASDVIVKLFNDGIMAISGGWDMQGSNPLRNWPMFAILILGFFVRDFVQWWIHRLLHRSKFLWEFHKVHHSVEQMGFAAHLRYHWMETIVYKSIEYIPLALLGIGLYDFFIIHIFTLAWGHYNHANISVKKNITGAVVGLLIGIILSQSLVDINIFTDSSSAVKIGVLVASIVFGYFGLGPLMKYLFNSPEMHIWHHAYDLPKSKKYGVNFGLTLSLWDYIFGTAYIPQDGEQIKLGFPGVEEFPGDFIHQSISGFKT